VRTPLLLIDKPKAEHGLDVDAAVCSVDATSARNIMIEIRRRNEVAMRERVLQVRRSEEWSKDVNVDDYTRYLSSILAGLSIQAANGVTKADLADGP